MKNSFIIDARTSVCYVCYAGCSVAKALLMAQAWSPRLHPQIWQCVSLHMRCRMWMYEVYQVMLYMYACVCTRSMGPGSCHGSFFLANLWPVPPPCSFDPDLISCHVFAGEGRPWQGKERKREQPTSHPCFWSSVSKKIKGRRRYGW